MVETVEARDRINIAACGVENESRLMAVIAESLGGGATNTAPSAWRASTFCRYAKTSGACPRI